MAIGLASAAYPDDEVYDEAVKLAARYAAGPAAITLAKKAILDGYALSLDEALAVEVEAFAACFDTDDAHTGVTSFLENGPGKAVFLRGRSAPTAMILASVLLSDRVGRRHRQGLLLGGRGGRSVARASRRRRRPRSSAPR